VWWASLSRWSRWIWFDAVFGEKSWEVVQLLNHHKPDSVWLRGSGYLGTSRLSRSQKKKVKARGRGVRSSEGMHYLAEDGKEGERSRSRKKKKVNTDLTRGRRVRALVDIMPKGERG